MKLDTQANLTIARSGKMTTRAEEYYKKDDPGYVTRRRSQIWANNLHGLLVCLGNGCPGVALSQINPGGWGYIKILYEEMPLQTPGSVNQYSRLSRIKGRNFHTQCVNWSARHRIKEVPLKKMILLRLKGEDIGQIMSLVNALPI